MNDDDIEELLKLMQRYQTTVSPFLPTRQNSYAQQMGNLPFTPPSHREASTYATPESKRTPSTPAGKMILTSPTFVVNYHFTFGMPSSNLGQHSENSGSNTSSIDALVADAVATPSSAYGLTPAQYAIATSPDFGKSAYASSKVADHYNTAGTGESNSPSSQSPEMGRAYGRSLGYRPDSSPNAPGYGAKTYAGKGAAYVGSASGGSSGASGSSGKGK